MDLKSCFLRSQIYINVSPKIFEPHREKTGLLPMQKTKAQISFAVIAKLINAFVFATRIVFSLLLKVRIEGPGIDAIKFKVPT